MIHRFGTFEFDDQGHELRRQGRLVSLEPQPARVLALLVRRSGDVVTRDELTRTVWGAETHVDFDRGLAYCLSEIRHALGDKGENPRFVETLPRRGYRFIAPVSAGPPGQSSEPAPASPVLDTAASPAAPGVGAPSGRSWRGPLFLVTAVTLLVAGVGVWRWRDGVATTARPAVIAVSVFDNETGDPQYDTLVSNLSDTVVVRLTRLDPRRVAVVGNAEVLRRPRNIRNLKAVAAAVDAQYVVLGQLQQHPTGWRFITHFVRLPDETHLDANRVEVTTGDRQGLESAVLAAFESAVDRHVLRR